jgi:N-acetylmuramoyl-L-alanine amidase
VHETDHADTGRPEGASSGARAKIVSIEPYGSSDRARVVISLDRPAEYRVRELEGPSFVVEFDATEASAKDLAVGGLVQRVRVSRAADVSRVSPGGPQAAGSARVVFELANKAYQRVFYLPEPYRVIVDVAAHPPTPSSQLRGAERALKRVALDAGHGGSDPGAIGPSGLREKDVTLDIAHLAAPVLSRELGILTLLTRDDDRVVALDERAARANAFHADLFVSIHCNASENSRAHGIMSFVLDASPDEVTSKMAARENATSLLINAQLASVTSGPGALELGAHSKHLAQLLQRATMSSLASRFADASDQGVKTAGFFVLVGAEMPSVLFETSFISNPAEEKRLGTQEYRQKLADAIVNAVRAYREGH